MNLRDYVVQAGCKVAKYVQKNGQLTESLTAGIDICMSVRCALKH
jgi:hypothetical protein